MQQRLTRRLVGALRARLPDPGLHKVRDQGTVVLMLLRRIAYHFLVLYRHVTLRSDEARATPWRQLIRWFYNVLIAATDEHLEGLRRRTAPLSALD